MRKIYILVWCLFLTATALGQQTGPFTLTGRVVDFMSRPVAGATVVCYKSVYKLNQRSYEPLGRTQTTSKGRFSLQVDTENFPDHLFAGKQGMALGWKEIYHAGEPTIRLSKPSRFKGTVVDQAGRPVQGAKVRICLKNEMMARRSIAPPVPESWFISRTDTRGQFIFDNIPSGTTADFGVEAHGRTSIWTACDFGPQQGEQFTTERTDIRILLPAEARINGYVVDERTGRTAAGICVQAMPYNHTGTSIFRDPVQTGKNGRFELAGLAPGKYLLRVSSDENVLASLTVTVESGQVVRDVKISLNKGVVPFEVTVYGHQKGRPVENAKVFIEQKDAVSRYTTFQQNATTDANGLARLSAQPGDCEIRAFKKDYGFQIQSIHIEPGQMLRHEMFLPRMAVVLSGRVLDEYGHVLTGASVMYRPLGYFCSFPTDADGQFEIRYYSSRVPSTVRVLARHIPSGLGAIAQLRDSTKSGKLHGRIILKLAYVLTGCVTDPNGRSIPAAYVRLLQKRYGRLFTEVVTDADGVYCIRSVPPEEDDFEYAIAVRAEGFGLTQINQIPFHDNTAEPIHLDPIVLQHADKVISGVVQDLNDQPVAGVLVSVYGPRLSISVGQSPCGETLTDAQGRFRIAGVCKEPLRIYAKSPPPQQQSGETWAHGGNENVRVVLGQKLIFSPSLIGKPLPELKNLKVELSSADADDKIILVCFWDMEQRPSRNCIMRLAKQAEQLKQKRIAIAAVQASKIDENELNEWVKKSSVPFPVGMIEGDEEQTRFTWGVRSLPWLILTDRQHIVRAEGFALAELDEKISANTQK